MSARASKPAGIGIGALALVGDTRTAVLVDPGGDAQWLCLPHFDGEPVFAALVAGERGGSFLAGPADAAPVVHRAYRPGTPVLETVWRVDGAEVVLTEGLVTEVEGALLPTMCYVRRLEARGGPARCVLRFDPRYGDDRHAPARVRRAAGGLVCIDRGIALWLGTSRPLAITPGRRVPVTVKPGEPLTVVLTGAHRGPLTYLAPGDAWRALFDDERRWRMWSAGIELDGQFAPAVERSLITLRLLTYSPSGAPVAAPTTSLPECVGGPRNWDYRFAWPRDASIGIGAFLGVGRRHEAWAFLYWLLHATRLERPELPAMLTLHGRHVPAEREVPAWPGFAGSRPVRFGNAARDQHQLDTYGWVVDAMWLLEHSGNPLFAETWRAAQALAGCVADRWREPDSGIWEVRGPPRHYVHSKLMAWLALDRALRIGETQRLRPQRRERWRRERDAIRADLDANGLDERGRHYVRAYDDAAMDAALLVLPLLGIDAPDSPRTRATVDAVRDQLSAGGPLLFRYRRGDDHLPGEEGAFLPCSFWLVQALAATGRVDEAEGVMADALALAGPLGLLAEEADPGTGEQLGNFPQAFTHATVVQAALAIRDATKAAAEGRGQSRTPRARPASPPVSAGRS